MTPQYTQEVYPCNRCSHLLYDTTNEILVSFGDSIIYYRKMGGNTFSASPLSLSRPHSITYLADKNIYYLNDTLNNRILAVSSIEKGKVIKEITKIAGIDLHEPHDILYDEQTGWLYSINPRKPVIFRFRHGEIDEDALDLSAELGYSRALSLVGGKLYVVGSSFGRVVEITDFEAGEYTIYQSFGKKNRKYAGNWESDGLIINDIEYFHGYWYATSYFCSTYSLPGQDFDKNKFIRFRNWQEFENGDWQDLSHMLPSGQVPYYLTAGDKGLAVVLFSHEVNGIDDADDNVFNLTYPCDALPAILSPLL